jgi:filamentous hemagglutinin family protein
MIPFWLGYQTTFMKLRRHSCQNAVGIVSCCLLSVSPVAAQQIAEDGTLSTNVTSSDGLNFTITNGERAGGNLFHSFSQFSVPTGGSALFNNALDVENIIGRVTGGSVSNIDGLIRTNGTANLFLLNPSGIIFGPNAQLNIGGSFLASTANAVKFADGTEFSATTPSSPPLLTVSVPIGLQYGGMAGIQVQESTLAVQPDRTLALVGGDIAIVDGNLTAPSGRVELGAVAGTGTVGLTVANNQMQLSFPDGIPRADLSLTNGAVVDASGSGGGNIQLVGRQITVQDSWVKSTTQGSEAGGDLTVNASDTVELIGNDAGGQFSYGLFAETQGMGAAGNLSITTRQLTVRGEARVSAATFGAGRGGNLTVNAAESVELIGIDPPNDDTLGMLFTGLLTDAESTGAAGNLTINTRRLIVRDGAQVSASTFDEGAGGNLTVNATESVELLGVSPSDLLASGLFTAVNPPGTGQGGNIEVNTRRLLVQDGAQIFAGTLSVGDGGNLTVNASSSVEVAGVSPIIQFPSALFSTAEDFQVQDMGLTVGNAGDLTINTRQLIVRDGGLVAAAATGNAGQGGNLTVNALESVEVIGKNPGGIDSDRRSSISAETTGGSGDSGTVTINTGQLIVRDEALVSVNNDGSGKAGNLEVQARSIFLDNGGTIEAQTASGEGGNIRLQLQDLLVMRRNSLISAEAGGTGNGGNIDIDTQLLVALENSDIIANAVGGFGGRVEITTQGIFGTQARRDRTPESDITASSAAGPQFDGVVEIQTPDVDPTKGIVALPEEVVDVTGLIAQGCGTGRVAQSSQFILTGRGGLSPNPGGTIPSDTVLEDLGTVPVQRARKDSGTAISTKPTRPSAAPLVEAQGWVINSSGQLVLTAQAPTVTPHSSWLTSASCHAH